MSHHRDTLIDLAREPLRQDKRDDKGKTPVYGSNGIVGYHSVVLVEKPCLIVGRKGTAGQVHLSRVPCWPIDTTYYVIPPTNVDLSFLYYLLSSLKLSRLDKSTAIPGLNRNDAYSIEIPLPPLSEQHRIVAKIEELFTRLDAGAEALKKAKAQLKRYRQAVLKAAVEGKLTEEWREAHQGQIEPASVLLERTREERRKKGKHKGIPTLDLFQDEAGQADSPLSQSWERGARGVRADNELPEGWVWATLIALAELKGGITKGQKYKEGVQLRSVPYLRVANVL